MKTLFVTGPPHPSDDFIIQQLKQAAPDLDIHSAADASAAIAELSGSSGYRGVVTAPGLPRHEALTLIATLRRDQTPIAVAAVVLESDQDSPTLLIAQGADEVIVMRDGTLLFAPAAVIRMRQSPHLRPTDTRQYLRVLYAGQDSTVGELLDRMPFVKVERVDGDAEGNLSLRSATPGDERLRCDAVVIDVPLADPDPQRLVKSVRAHTVDVPIVILTAPERFDAGVAALDLGAESHIVKMGGFKRRLVATLHRLHERLQMTVQHALLRSREARARHIVECMPEGLAVIGENGVIHAINSAGLPFAGATKAADVVGVDVCTLVAGERGDEVRELLSGIGGSARLELEVELEGLDGLRRRVDVRAAPIAHDVRGGRAAVAVMRPHVPAPAPADTAETLAELERAVGDLQDARTQCDVLGRRLADERTALNAAHNKTAALDAARTRAEEALKAAQTELDAARAAIQEHERRRFVLETAASGDRTALDAATAKAETLEAERTAAAEALQAAQAELEAAHAAGREQGQRRAELELAVVVDRRALEAALARAAVLESARASLDEALKASQAELEAAQSAARAAHDRDLSALDALRRTSDERGAACARLEVALRDAKQSGDDRAAALEAAHADVRRSLERQLEDATGRLQELTEKSQAWRTLEDRLMQARRIEEVGRLAASMMPDIEGLVASIANCGERLATGLAESDPRIEAARALREHTTRTASLVRQLMAFSVRLAQPAAPIDLNEAVAQAEPLLRRIVGDHIAFDVRLGASSRITASQGDLDQLLTALVGTVSDGLPVGGSLTLDTDRVEGALSDAGADAAAPPAALAQITVRATGYGIEPTQPSRALALAVARCGGQVRAESGSHIAALVVALPVRASGTPESSDGERSTRSAGTVIEASAGRFAARRSAS